MAGTSVARHPLTSFQRNKINKSNISPSKPSGHLNRWRPAFAALDRQAAQPQVMPFPHPFGQQSINDARSPTMLAFLGQHPTPAIIRMKQPGMISIQPDALSVPGETLVRHKLPDGRLDRNAECRPSKNRSRKQVAHEGIVCRTDITGIGVPTRPERRPDQPSPDEFRLDGNEQLVSDMDCTVCRTIVFGPGYLLPLGKLACAQGDLH